jgi:hypothetical protein
LKKQPILGKVFWGEKCVTNKEHQSNIKRIEKAIEASNVQLRRAARPVKGLRANQKNFQSLKSSRPLPPSFKRGLHKFGNQP